jgi:hypothetical protein
MTYAKLNYTVSPITVTVLDYSKTQINWSIPTSASTGVSGFRLIRSTDGFSETPEDGVILFTDSTLTNSSRYSSSSTQYYFIDDGTVSPLVGGQYIYYNFWVFYNNQWQEAGRQLTVLAKSVSTSTSLISLTKTSTHDRFMESLPRVLTSNSQNSLDAVDTSSDLYVFMQGFSYTLDELLTSAKLAIPAQNFRKASPVISTLVLKNYGFTAELNLPIQNQKKLASKVLYITSRRGTLDGLRTWAESITGFNSRITQNSNLLFGMLDSYLNKNFGFASPNWYTDSGSLSVDTAQPDPSYLSNYALNAYVRSSFDTLDGGRTTPSSTFYPAYVSIAPSNSTGINVSIGGSGTLSGLSDNLPAVAGTQYDFSFYTMQDSTSTFNAGVSQVSIQWFDINGAAISTSTLSVTSGGVYTWVRKTVTATAPSGSVSASISVKVSRGSGTYSGSAAKVFLTMLQWSVYDGTTHLPYYEPRGVSIIFEPRKANLLSNPSFEHNTPYAGWAITGGTVTTPLLTDGGGPSVYGNGTKKLRIVGPSTGDTSIIQTFSDTIFSKVGVRGYTFSFYAKASASVTATMGMGYGGGGIAQYQNIAVTTTWQRFSMTWQLPPSVVNPTLYVYLASTLAGVTLEVDATQVELGYSATEYFDGNAKFGYWTTSGGEQDQYAQSVQYPNLELKMSRIQTDIGKYLRSGTPYWIQYFGPDSFVRYSGISW